MYIEKVIDEDGEGHSWDVIVSDGEHKLLCFASSMINEKCNNIKLDCYFADEINKTDKTEFNIKKIDGTYYEYKIIAQVIDSEKGIMRVYGFEFCFNDNLPDNVSNGDYIDFIVLRMDCQTHNL